MKNRGFLTLSTLPLGQHKTEESPNSQRSEPVSCLQLKPGDPKASALPTPQSKKNRKARRSDTCANPTANEPDDQKRYTLLLQIDASLADRLPARLSNPSQAIRQKRSLSRELRRRVIEGQGGTKLQDVANAIIVRVDLQLPVVTVDRLLGQGRHAPFEAKSTILSRAISPYLSEIIEEISENAFGSRSCAHPNSS